MAQYNRIYKLTIGVQGGKGFRLYTELGKENLNIGFNISKDLTQQTNKGTITIYNLSDETAKLVEQDDAIVELEVGYAEDVGLRRIFIGYITEVKTSFSNGERKTEISASDGQIAIRNCVVALSYAGNVSRKKVIDDVAQEMGLNVNYAPDCEFESFPKGFSFVGAGRACMDKVCIGSKLSWSIQNNMIQVIKAGGTTKIQAIKLTAASGLIGSVESVLKAAFIVAKDNSKTSKQTNKRKSRKQGYKVKCLLQPTLSPGDLVYIESKLATGWFKCDKLTHTGEYMGNNWYTDIEVHEITDDSKTEGTKK